MRKARRNFSERKGQRDKKRSVGVYMVVNIIFYDMI